MGKYLPFCYRNQLFDHFLNYRQISMMSKYVERFNELMLITRIREDPFHIIRRFINGLREDIRREIELYALDSLEEAYQKAIAIERYLKIPQCRLSCQVSEFRYSRPGF